MAKILAKGESVYQCNTCNRSIRVPTNRQGIDVIQQCIITASCTGRLRRITIARDVNNTPAFPPDVTGVNDWFQRSVLAEHVQAIKTITWTVIHNLGSFPHTYVYVNRVVDGTETLVQITPKSVAPVDLNTLLITFDQPEKGMVQCVATSSKNTVNQSITTGTVLQVATTQITTTIGELTIATLDQSTSINVGVTYNSPASITPVPVTYLSASSPTIDSPWVNTSKVIMNGRTYTVRSFNILTTQLAPPLFSSGVIVNGATISFPDVANVNNTLILLAHPPYQSVDRIYDTYIDVATINKTLPEIYYQDGKWFCAPTIIKSTYPPIIAA